MGLFGSSLFSKKQTEFPELYDFAKHGLLRNVDHIGMGDISLMEVSGDDEQAATYLDGVRKNNAEAKKRAATKQYTPKEVWQLKTLNDDAYTLNTDEDYIEKNVKSLLKKMALLPQPKTKKKKRNRGYNPHEGMMDFAESYGASKYGYQEMESLVERLENRRLYAENKEFFDEYPYTRSDLINDVLEAHGNLRSKRVEEFIPDMPDEAVDAMTAYREKVREMCGKDPVFYIIADKKDFGEIDKKRDPILLAQSPFALGWQILGAWDEEMVYLGDL